MSRRKLLAVPDLPLVGGAVCLDLVNTTGARASEAPRERLRSYDDLLVWSFRAGLLDAAGTDRLRAATARRRSEAQRALQRVCEFRELLYQVFRPVAEGTKPPVQAVTRLGRWWRVERSHRELVMDERGFELRLRVSPKALDGMVWPIVTSAIELLASERIALIRRCGECDWLFLDETRNGSRTWCKKVCGDRVRARRHYQRIRERKRDINEDPEAASASMP